MHLSRNGRASVCTLHEPPKLLQTQGISRSLLILACLVQNTLLLSESCLRSSTQQVLCEELSWCHPNRTGRTSHSSCFSHSSEPGVLHHIINQLRVQLSRCGHPGIRMLMEFLLVQGSFPFFFFFSLKVSQKKSLPASKLGITLLTWNLGTELGAKPHQSKAEEQRFLFNGALEQNPNTH